MTRRGSIYINEGAPPAPGGKQLKHLRQSCPVLREREDQGYPARSIPNPDSKLADVAGHKLERCTVCFRPGGPIRNRVEPPWLHRAADLEHAYPAATYWVYDLHHPKAHVCQVGMAKNVTVRLRARWHATCKGRWGQDAVPWLYDLLVEGRGEEVVADLHPYPTRDEARAAEKRLRDERLRAGWEVSSSV